MGDGREYTCRIKERDASEYLGMFEPAFDDVCELYLGAGLGSKYQCLKSLQSTTSPECCTHGENQRGEMKWTEGQQ